MLCLAIRWTNNVLTCDSSSERLDIAHITTRHIFPARHKLILFFWSVLINQFDGFHRAVLSWFCAGHSQIDPLHFTYVCDVIKDKNFLCIVATKTWYLEVSRGFVWFTVPDITIYISLELDRRWDVGAVRAGVDAGQRRHFPAHSCCCYWKRGGDN